MTSSNGKIFRVTGYLCGEFTGHRWLPRKKASDAELWFFSLICVWINGWENNREAGDLRCHRAHCDVIVMYSALYKPWDQIPCADRKETRRRPHGNLTGSHGCCGCHKVAERLLQGRRDGCRKTTVRCYGLGERKKTLEVAVWLTYTIKPPYSYSMGIYGAYGHHKHTASYINWCTIMAAS